MEFPAKHAIAALILWGLASYPSAAQREIQKHPTGKNVSGDEARVAPQQLTPDDGLAVIAAALDSRVHLRAKRDCSHLVHAIYDRAGFPYSYVDSSDLYVGTPDFERVSHPQPGDLVVWPGHVGIVINPSKKVFFSAMHSGPGIDAFDAPYWKRREPARFYRYVKRASVQNARNARDRILLTHQRK
jgi:cell wall-associated NlpC family hydrolase